MNSNTNRRFQVTTAIEQNGDPRPYLLSYGAVIRNLQVLEELEDTLQRSMNYGAISQLSSSIGHEIRNPLSSLAIHTEIVDSMVSKTVNDEKRLAKIN